MSSPEIVICEFIDPDAVADLAADYDVHYDPDLVDDGQRLVELVADCKALIVRNRTQVRAPLLDHCNHLKAVGRLGVGLDNIDLDACARRGISVLPATGANAIAVAEHVLTAALILRRGVYFSSADVAAGRWPRQQLMGHEVYGACLGLVGFGVIAQAVAQRAQAFGMQIVIYDPWLESLAGWENVVRCDSLEDLLARADVVSLHVPLTEQTANMLDASALALMKPGAIVINTARGGIIDEAHLAARLLDGSLGGAMIDVFEAEPLAAGSPFCDVMEQRPGGLILTPHIAGISVEANRRVSRVTAQNVRRVLTAQTE